ncbi:MAG: hypothetical protein JWP12_3605 [Bacteroidetes bacterium]|nr:hypothetical protein [Bacteroidota bacterium]
MCTGDYLSAVVGPRQWQDKLPYREKKVFVTFWLQKVKSKFKTIIIFLIKMKSESLY